ncbi:MAG: mechanosensitive ion channel family protein [Solirubrobacteraceae bacterium]
MHGGDVLAIGSSFPNKYSHQLTAVLILVLTLVCVVLTDRSVAHWAARADLDAAVDTRIRFMRRLIKLGIGLLGVLFAVSELEGLNKLAAGVLASGAIVAAIVGFAARQTLANLIAGVMLTVAQPVRIGDRVTLRDKSGVVEDVRLNYTVLQTPEGGRLLVPNERLAAEVLGNDTILDARIRPEVSLWVPLAADTDAAISALAGIEVGLIVRVAEITPESVRITLSGEPLAAPELAARVSDLRAAALRALRTAQLLA